MNNTAGCQESGFSQLPTIEEFTGIFTMDAASETVVTTFCGKEVDLLAPALSSICIRDIAQHESLINRYNGAVEHSVAYHSYLASKLVPDSEALAVLLHDAAEAYVGDDVRQKKNIVSGTRELEDRLQRKICEKYGLTWPLSPIVKQADLAVYALELVKLLGWTHKVKTLPDAVRNMKIEPKRPEEARHLFLTRFYDLYYGTRVIRFENGALFFSGKAGAAFTALTRSFDIKSCCESMESGVVRTQSATGLFLRKAA
jgi:hypothetical protein